MIPSSGPIRASEIDVELGGIGTEKMTISAKEVRELAGRGTGPIRFSDFKAKRSTPAYILIGSATNACQRYEGWDTGIKTFYWYNIPISKRIRTRVWASVYGSHRNRGWRGYVYISWTIKSISGTILHKGVKVDRHTIGDGSGGIGNWSQAFMIRDIINNKSYEKVNVEISMRMCSGAFVAHIWGGRNTINRICGIESEVGY